MARHQFHFVERLDSPHTFLYVMQYGNRLWTAKMTQIMLLGHNGNIQREIDNLRT
jgi:hypothetical protein